MIFVRCSENNISSCPRDVQWEYFGGGYIYGIKGEEDSPFLQNMEEDAWMECISNDVYSRVSSCLSASFNDVVREATGSMLSIEQVRQYLECMDVLSIEEMNVEIRHNGWKNISKEDCTSFLKVFHETFMRMNIFKKKIFDDIESTDMEYSNLVKIMSMYTLACEWR